MLLEPYGDVSHYRVKINHSVVLSRHWPALAVGKRGVCALDGVDGAAVEVVATKAAELRAQMARSPMLAQHDCTPPDRVGRKIKYDH